MRTTAVLLVVGAVLLASVLDLALGVLWVAALVGVWLLRRRLSLAAPLVLVASAGLVVWGAQLGWFSRPAPAPYEEGWLPVWPASRAGPEPPTDSRILARDRLAALRRDELRLTGAELEQRAGAVLLLTRRLDVVRGDAPREVAAVEAAARRLARTMAAPEFRNLEARRAAAAGHLGELERRLGTVGDVREAADLMRAADAAAMAHVSLRPVRDDLASADAAVAALVRVLGGSRPSAAVTATARYDEARGEVAWEVRHVVTGEPGLRLIRIETRAFRSAGPPERPLELRFAAGQETLRPVPPGDWMELGPAARGASIVAAWVEAAPVKPIRSTLRPLVFERLQIALAPRGDEAVAIGVLDAHPGIEIPLVVPLAPPSVARVTLPRHGLYFASGAGTVASGPDGDVWTSAGGQTGTMGIDLVPRTLLLRNALFARVREYLYRPNPVTLTVATGLAALTLVLTGVSSSRGT